MRKSQEKSLDYWDIIREIIEVKKNWRKYLKIILDNVKKIDEGAEVYVFGSAVEGNLWGGSDIDILVKPSKKVDHGDFISKIEEGLPEFHPFQFHIADDISWDLFYSKVPKVPIEKFIIDDEKN